MKSTVGGKSSLKVETDHSLIIILIIVLNLIIHCTHYLKSD